MIKSFSANLIYEIFYRVPIFFAPIILKFFQIGDPISFYYHYSYAMIIWFLSDFGIRYQLIKLYSFQEKNIWLNLESHRITMIFAISIIFLFFEQKEVIAICSIYCIAKGLTLDWISKIHNHRRILLLMGFLQVCIFYILFFLLNENFSEMFFLMISQIFAALIFRVRYKAGIKLLNFDKLVTKIILPIGLLTSLPNVLYNLPFLFIGSYETENNLFIYLYRIALALNFGVASFSLIYFINNIHWNSSNNIKTLVTAKHATFLLFFAFLSGLLIFYDIDNLGLLLVITLVIVRSLREFIVKDMIKSSIYDGLSYFYIPFIILVYLFSFLGLSFYNFQFIVFLILVIEILFLFLIRKTDYA